MAAMMGLESLENLSHAMEDVLEEIRSHKRPLSQNLVDILLEGHDFWQEALKDIEEGGLDKVGDSRTLIEKIRAAEGGGLLKKGHLNPPFCKKELGAFVFVQKSSILCSIWQERSLLSRIL